MLATSAAALNDAACDVLMKNAASLPKTVAFVTALKGPMQECLAAWEDPLNLGCSAPPTDAWRSLRGDDALSQAAHDVLCSSDPLPWKEPKDLSASYQNWASGALRSLMLTGQKKYGAVLLTDDCYAGLWWLSPDTAYPCHAHEADEVFVVLSGGATASWRVDGALADESVGASGVIHIPPGTPHSVRSGAEPLLVWYAWTGKLVGEYWFCEHGAAAEPSRARRPAKLVRRALPRTRPQEAAPTRTTRHRVRGADGDASNADTDGEFNYW